MRTIIAGSRDCSDDQLLADAMAACGWRPSAVLSGAARGVDRLGEEWAARNGIPVERFPADWDRYKKAAGYRRNAEMAARAEALVALWDGKSPGTRHMIELGTRAGLRVHVYRIDLVRQCALQGARKERAMTVYQPQWFQRFLHAYFAAAVWSSVDENGAPLGDRFKYEDFAENSRLQQISQCHDFVSANFADMAALDPGECGRDFWLTRCRHGAGFWDRALGDVGERLTEASKVYGGVDLYVGDDGKVHASGCEQEPWPDDVAFLPPALTASEIYRLRILWSELNKPSVPLDQSLVEKGYAISEFGVTRRNEAQPVFTDNGKLLYVIRQEPAVAVAAESGVSGPSFSG